MKSRFLFVVVALCCSGSAFAATRIWSGAGATNLWSVAANWSNGVPVNGDSVMFARHPLGFAQAAFNDLTNLSVAGIHSEAQGYTLNGGALRVTGDVIVGGPVAGSMLVLSVPVELGPGAHQFITTNNGNLRFAGLLNASSGSVVTIAGAVNYGFSPQSDYRAETRLPVGFLPLLFTRLKGPLIIGGGGPTNFANVAMQSRLVFGEFPPVTVLTNGTLINVATLQDIGAFTVNGGTLLLGGASPEGRLAVRGDARFSGGAEMIASAFSSGVPGELSVTGRVVLAGCRLRVQSQIRIANGSHVIVRNDGSDPIEGLFEGVTEGGVVTNDVQRLTVSYRGGDGNDVTLTPVVDRARIVNADVSNRVMRFTVQGQAGTQYVTEATTNLLSLPAQIPWMPIATNVAPGNGQFSIIDLDSPVFARRFYRTLTR